MSQSDYIKYKRVAVELNNQAKNLAPVIGAGQYTNYKAFTLENTIFNTKPNYMKLTPYTSVNVFGIQKYTPSDCSTFTLCTETNSRVNRKPLTGTQSDARPLPILQPHKTLLKLKVCNYC
jgi:hypothetical protein